MWLILLGLLQNCNMTFILGADWDCVFIVTSSSSNLPRCILLLEMSLNPSLSRPFLMRPHISPNCASSVLCLYWILEWKGLMVLHTALQSSRSGSRCHLKLLQWFFWFLNLWVHGAGTTNTQRNALTLVLGKSRTLQPSRFTVPQTSLRFLG